MVYQMKKSIQIKVIGLVQGVWFRASTLKMAKKLGVVGIVRNEADRSVYIEATGTTLQLDALVKWCHEGSELSSVDEVVVSEMKTTNFQDFSIQR